MGILRLVFAGLFCFAGYRWGDWKNWRKYHSTILFLIASDFLVAILTSHHTLWDLSSSIGNHTINQWIINFFVFPSVTLLFFKNYPRELHKQIIRILFWAFLFTAVEYVEYRVGNIRYANGWNIWWSAFLNLMLFSFMRLHHIKPFVAYPIFGALVVLMCYLFDISLDELK